MAEVGNHSGATVPGEPTRVLRAIARMNVGGPAHHVSLLSGRAFPDRFRTLLVSGTVGADEASFERLAAERGATLRTVPHLGPEVDPLADARALRELVRVVRAFRPAHRAHAHRQGWADRPPRGALPSARGRSSCTRTTGTCWRVTSPRGSAPPTRAWSRRSRRSATGLIGVSQATVDDLVRLGVAPPEQVRGHPARPAARALPVRAGGARRARSATSWACADGEVLATFTGRLVPIKRLDVLLDGVAAADARARPCGSPWSGDGPERAELERRAQALGSATRCASSATATTCPSIWAGSDLAVLSSDNEGTPVSLIEAGAAGRPLVSTLAGGVADVDTRGDRSRRRAR